MAAAATDRTPLLSMREGSSSPEVELGASCRGRGVDAHAAAGASEEKEATSSNDRVEGHVTQLEQYLEGNMNHSQLAVLLEEIKNAELREMVWERFQEKVFSEDTRDAISREEVVSFVRKNLIIPNNETKSKRLHRLFEVIAGLSLPSERDDFFFRFTQTVFTIKNKMSQLNEVQVDAILAESKPLADSLRPEAIAKKMINELSYWGRPKRFIWGAYQKYLNERLHAPIDAPNKRLALCLAGSVAECYSKKGQTGLDSLDFSLEAILLAHVTHKADRPIARLSEIISISLNNQAVFQPSASEVAQARNAGHHRMKDNDRLDPIIDAFQRLLQRLNTAIDAENANDFKRILEDLGLLSQPIKHAEEMIAPSTDNFPFAQLCQKKVERSITVWVWSGKPHDLKQKVLNALLRQPIYQLIGHLNPEDYKGLDSAARERARAVEVCDVATATLGGISLIAAGVAGYAAWERGHPPSITPAPTPPPAPVKLPLCPTQIHVTHHQAGEITMTDLSFSGPDSAGNQQPFHLQRTTVVSTMSAPIGEPLPPGMALESNYSAEVLDQNSLPKSFSMNLPNGQVTIAPAGVNGTSCDTLRFDNNLSLSWGAHLWVTAAAVITSGATRFLGAASEASASSSEADLSGSQKVIIATAAVACIAVGGLVWRKCKASVAKKTAVSATTFKDSVELETVCVKGVTTLAGAR